MRIQDPDRFLHKILSVTSGSVTMTEIMDSYRKATNKPMPAAPAILGSILLRMNSASQNMCAASTISSFWILPSSFVFQVG